MKLIVGLGNPGREYERTPHNLGFRVIQSLLAAEDETPKAQSKFQCQLYKSGGTLLAKPQTFMNQSGQAVGQILAFYKIEPAQMLVIYDDIDLPLGSLRTRLGGGSSGHKGVESIIQTVGPDFYRLRLGINKGLAGDLTQYVLKPLSNAEHALLEPVIQKAAGLATEFSRGQLPLISIATEPNNR